MKFIIFLLSFALVAIPTNSRAAERKFAIGNFENIQITGNLVVNITTDVPTSARATGSRNQLNEIQFSRNSSTLKISLKRSHITRRSQNSNTLPLEIFISTRRLKDITIRGNASVTINKVYAKKTKFLILGAGVIDVKVAKIDDFNIRMQGNGRININQGIASRSDFLIDGGGIIEAAGLATENATIVHKGTANTRITVSKVANIENNGAGKIEILGKANCIIKSAGSGQILCKNNG